ncbi:phosphoglycerate mutase-like protein [Coniochaeta ligniaria NRRL 30616]|uniref:Phosphoglycerate mutase-like protein n=1 Tax=Coniochaeta ligniaria NRRL 30616 TaxID=1408157 RepID=A0A1J7IPS8_9PEZI|nr:phosphoglycerate mutase-like protein [Coniochaeta ligniaria NRRL 30616]
MPPTLVLIRHAQALHNVNEKYHLPDPNLSGTGLKQCLELREHLKTALKDLDVGLIVVSPMRRTIQTAILSLDWLMDAGVPVVASALWQENSAKPCDTGSPIAELEEEFPMVDFSWVDAVYPDKTSPAGAVYAFNRKAIVGRAQRALGELRGRDEKAVVVVSHSGFMRQGMTGCWFFNADYRVFEFEGEGLGLRQWEATRKGGLGKSFEERVVVGEGIPEEDKVPVGA